ncbi:MAG: OmpH family outer membrane protein [Fimbriimonadaceae bacterium]|nr:OmpH family outer membrane protein [Fimbriimonadaceae bacterium]
MRISFKDKAMQNSGFMKMGWVVAAAMGAVVLFSGFQDNTNKMGVVNLATVFNDSEFGKKRKIEGEALKQAREGLLEFLDTYRVMTIEQAQRIRELSLKPTVTAAEKAELERLKADVIAADKKAKEYSQKASLTPEERQLLIEYTNRSQQIIELANRWLRDFTQELQTWDDKTRTEGLDKTRVAIQQAAKQQGYSIVLDASIAPYAANDMTDAALKAMNANK